MNTTKSNRRTKLTRKIIRDSLLELLSKKPITKITIKEICELADLNRSTFYAHYNDQYDLLKKIEQEIIDDLNSHINIYLNQTKDIDEYLVIENILDYMLNNKELFLVLFGENGNKEFANNIADIIRNCSIYEWLKSGAVEPDIAEYLYTFAESGGTGLIIKWINDGCLKTPKEMAALIIRIIKNGIASFTDTRK